MCHEALLRSGPPGGRFLLVLYSPSLRFVLFFFSFHFEIIKNLKAQRIILDPCSDSNICFTVFSHMYVILSDLFESRLPTSRLYSIILQHAFLKNKAVNYLDHSLVIKFNIDVMLLSTTSQSTFEFCQLSQQYPLEQFRFWFRVTYYILFSCLFSVKQFLSSFVFHDLIVFLIKSMFLKQKLTMFILYSKP